MKINFDDYKTLQEKYQTADSFISVLSTLFRDDFNYYLEDSMVTTIQNFLTKIGKSIYMYYYDDKIAYEDEEVFAYRLANDIAINVNRYFEMMKVEFYLVKDSTTNDKWCLTTKTSSVANESGKSGSAVLQSSASTPTGVSPSSTGSTIEMEDTEDGKVFENNGYVDKYTNFQAKTNGLHKNDIDRTADVSRSGNYDVAIELLKKFPKSFMEQVLKDVSKHFIYVY